MSDGAAQTESRPLPRWMPALLAATVAGIPLGMRFVDVPLTTWVYENQRPAIRRVLYQVSEMGDGHWWFGLAIGLWLVPTYVIPPARRALGLAPLPPPRVYLGRVSAFMIAVLVSGGLVVNVLKHAVGRSRPTKLLETGIAFDPFSVFHKADAFPSGHAQSVWSSIAVLAIVWPRYRYPLIAAAAVISLTRVAIVKHFLTDVAFSAVLSVVLAVAIERWFRERIGPFHRPQASGADV